MSSKKSVVILHNIMAPYKFPLFAALAQDEKINLEVLFMSKSAKNRRWSLGEKKLGFKYRILPKLEFNFFGKDLLTYIISYTFPFEFFRNKFDVLILNGWQDFACQVGILLCKLTGRRYIIWSESTVNEESWRRSLTLPLVKLMVRGADACIAIGTRSREYFEKLGAAPQKIFLAQYTVDVDHFTRESRVGQSEKNAIKAKIGISTSKVILYVGQFIERKGLKYLISAYNNLKKEIGDVSLVLVGYGPQKKQLEVQIGQKKIQDVFFKDHVELPEMPKMYAIADVFVLPSYEETWGLVINEAMAAGLPIVTTDKVGASEDLVRDSQNGFVVQARNSRALKLALEKIVTSEALRDKMGRKSREIIKDFTPERAAGVFAEAIKYATS